MGRLGRVSEADILEIREIIRLFVKKSLDSNEKIEAASRAAGISPIYLKKSLVGEKKKGGFDVWISLLIIAAKTPGDNLGEFLNFTLSKKRPFRNEASESEKIFCRLDRLDIINEDTKIKIAETLDLILSEMESRSR